MDLDGQPASATFTGESASGWQQVNFSSPVVIGPNATYVVSYLAPKGHYSDDVNYFYPPPMPNGYGVVDSAPLHAPRQTGTTFNGVFAYSTTNVFPTNPDFGDNYWVDLVFNPFAAAGPGDRGDGHRRVHRRRCGLEHAVDRRARHEHTVTPYINPPRSRRRSSRACPRRRAPR